MKNGYIEPSDADTLMGIYRKIDINGNLKEPLTSDEQNLRLTASQFPTIQMQRGSD